MLLKSIKVLNFACIVNMFDHSCPTLINKMTQKEPYFQIYYYYVWLCLYHTLVWAKLYIFHKQNDTRTAILFFLILCQKLEVLE